MLTLSLSCLVIIRRYGLCSKRYHRCYVITSPWLVGDNLSRACECRSSERHILSVVPLSCRAALGAMLCRPLMCNYITSLRAFLSACHCNCNVTLPAGADKRQTHDAPHSDTDPGPDASNVWSPSLLPLNSVLSSELSTPQERKTVGPAAVTPADRTDAR